jgi:regulator of protease activity HflC (stomatin/prohibitin superfamily)
MRQNRLSKLNMFGMPFHNSLKTTMRNVCGEMTLDELLSERDQASARIRELVASHSNSWGIEVQSVELKDISLPEDMQRTIGKQAEAERERRAVIINSEGEIAAAENLRKAAENSRFKPWGIALAYVEFD